jgi:hypothetical protein
MTNVMRHTMKLEDKELPEAVVEIFEEGAPDSVNVRSGRVSNAGSVELHGIEDEVGPIEFTRQVGAAVAERTGYIITGMRHHPSGNYIEVWLDPSSSSDDEHLTVAQRAARILDNRENDTRFEANISENPKEQYVDVYPDVSEQAGEDFSLKQPELERLRNEGLQLRHLSAGRQRSDFNEENYRIWFQPVK